MTMTIAHKRATRRLSRVRLKVNNICPTTGKRQYESELVAQRELQECAQLRARQGNCQVEGRYYLCPVCMKFHLTSQ